MSNREFWLAIAGILATAFTAAVGLYYTHKARTAAFRELLYSRQLDTIVGVLAAYGQLRDEMGALFGPHRDITAHDAVWHRVREAANAVANLVPEAVTFLPDSLMAAYTAMHDDSVDILRRIAFDDLPEAELDRFRAHGLAFANVARQHLGTNALSAETQRSFEKRVSSQPVTRVPQRAPDAV